MAKYYEDCHVYIVGTNELRNHELDNFLSDEFEDTTDTLNERKKRWRFHRHSSDIAEVGGRLCYMSFDTGRKDPQVYIDHIKEVQHGSVLEHSYFNLILTGVSRTLTHELVRHRAGMAFSQLSQRYVDSSNVGFVIPPEMLGDDYTSNTLRLNFKECCEGCLKTYQTLLDIKSSSLEEEEPDVTLRKKRARQLARSVLPGCTETKILVSANGRAIRHFLEMRANQAAAFEIRRLAVKIYKKLLEIEPRLFSDYKVITLEDGTEALETEWRKV